MKPTDKKNKFITWGLLGVIIITGIISMAVVTPEDKVWTRHLRENRVDWFKDWMGDSIFEGEMLGGSDIPVIVMIIAGVLYLLAWIPLIPSEKAKDKLSFLLKWVENRPKIRDTLERWRPQTGFILMSSLCIAMFVHANKWMTGRPRPKYVWEKGMAYSDWYEFGAYFVADGKFRGSFPSGHTATVISLLTLAYILLFDTKKVWVKFLGILTLIFTLGSSVMMLIARSMSNAHWVSDSAVSIFAGWLIIHIMYFWILQVPFQKKYFQENKNPLPLPFLYELIFTFLLLITCFGFMALVIGFRAIWIQNCPWLVVISPIGIIMIFYSLKLILKLNSQKIYAPQD